MVGFVPLMGTSTFDGALLDRFPTFQGHWRRFVALYPGVEALLPMLMEPGAGGSRCFGLVRPEQLARLLACLLDEDEFLSPYGLRSVSRRHAEAPLDVDVGGQVHRLDYEPGESTSDLFGGNSNWRGPIWLPMNRLLLLALEQYHAYVGEDYRVECPTGSGRRLTLHEVSRELAGRLARIFLRGADGRRPVFGDVALFNEDPHWRDLIPFHEYFHGDTGRGCGASHQTGWTGLIAELLVHYPAAGAAPGQEATDGRGA
jgi:hypothetical protein